MGTVAQGTECIPKKNAGSCSATTPGTHTPNPIHTGTGNKYWFESDYANVSPSGFQFTRQYNSENTAVTGPLGAGWHHRYSSSISTGFTRNDEETVYVTRPNGTSQAYTAQGNDFVAQDADVSDHLERTRDANGSINGWRYTEAATGTVETYDTAGKLIAVTSRAGFAQTLRYSNVYTPTDIAPKAGLLLEINDVLRRQITFSYDMHGRIREMVTDYPQQHKYQYAYDDSNNLISVTYPDNKVRRYHYNESVYTGGTHLPHALTGITDENGGRYASYYYNSDGKATASEHAGPVNQYQVSFSTDGSSSTITDPLGTTRTTHFTKILGVLKVTGQSQPGGSGCTAAASSITYDINGNIASRTDFNGNLTTYVYDLSRNLETLRVEGAGTSVARTITTEWHPVHSLITKIAEPKSITTYEYDTKGNMLSKSAQETTDASGSQGFAATAVGTPRIWRYTYNAFGKILSITGPRTDVDDVTRFSYSYGNLVRITNAAGQITTFSDHTPSGRPGKIIDPNGLITTLTYSSRGWLTRRKVGDETTLYDYDGIGQLIKVTQPDGSHIAYTYDDAHRLTEMADSAGNRIVYTLDAMGNRIKEEVKDPEGQLARQTTRVYDALNRLQEITGAMQ